MRSTLCQKYLKIIVLLLVFSLAHPLATKAETKESTPNLVNIYFFHSKDCSHCNSEIKFLDSIEKKYANINVYRFEVHDKGNNDLRIQIQQLYNLKGNSVPLTIIGDTPYVGYNEEISDVTFIKTIKYYSKYGYKDKIGELLEISLLPTYSASTKAPTLDEFIETYGNYKLIGNLTTNDLDSTENALLLGILSQLNPIKIIILIMLIILIVAKKIKPTIIPSYLIISLIYSLTNTIINSNDIVVFLMALILIIVNVIYYIKERKDWGYIKERKGLGYIREIKRWGNLNLAYLIGIIVCFLETKYCLSYNKAFREIITLYNLIGINQLNYYINYIFISFIINFLLILMYLSIKNKFSYKDIK